MDIEIYSLLATSILLISLATIVFSIYSYILFRVREGRKLKKSGGHGHGSGAPEPAEVLPEVTAEEVSASPETGGLAALAAAAGASVEPQRPEPAKVSTASGRFFKTYNPGS